MPTLSTWTDARLTRLVERYRNLYWPRSRRLRRYRIQRSELLEGAQGRCDATNHVLHVNVLAHVSDPEVRATVLHEMIHAVVDTADHAQGHGASFWTQLERLLVCRAPVTVGFPELGESGSHPGIIPVRFRHCRRLFRRTHERHQQDLKRTFKDKTIIGILPRDTESASHDAALEGLTWSAIWQHLAHEHGFIDLDGRLLPWARKHRVAARAGYLRGRQFFLEEKR